MNVLSNLLADTVVNSNGVTTTGSDQGMLMGIVTWLVIGLIAGFLGSKIVNKRGEGILMDIVLGIIGSFVGGFLIHLVFPNQTYGFIGSIVVATIGAILVLVIYHMVIRKTVA